MTVIYGWIAGILSVCYNIPQIYFTYKLKDVSSISNYSLLFRLTSGVLYIIHGYQIGDEAGYYMTTISTTQTLILIIQYFIYNKSNIIQPIEIE